MGIDGDPSRIASPGPPLRSIAPLAFWAAMAAVLTAIVVLALGAPGPLDDPHPADQRPGFLFDPGEARSVAGLRLAGDPIGRRPVLVVFDRQPPRPERLRRFLGRAPAGAALFIVVPQPSSSRLEIAGARLVRDRDGRLARALAMPKPEDGGLPVGYALVDSAARVRYSTLDPTYLDHGRELHAVGGSVR